MPGRPERARLSASRPFPIRSRDEPAPICFLRKKRGGCWRAVFFSMFWTHLLLALLLGVEFRVVYEPWHSGSILRPKNDPGLKERSRKVSHFSLQGTYPESSSERVLTGRRYPKLGRQRFESWGKVGVADRSASACRPPDDEAWTMVAAMVG